MPCLGRLDTLEPCEESTRSVQQLSRDAIAARVSEQNIERGRYVAPVATTVPREAQYLADVVLGVRQLALVEVADQFIEEGAAFRVYVLPRSSVLPVPRQPFYAGLENCNAERRRQQIHSRQQRAKVAGIGIGLQRGHDLRDVPTDPPVCFSIGMVV